MRERGEDHGAAEEDMAPDPGGEEVRFVFVELGDYGGNERWGPGREGFFLGGSDEYWKDKSSYERDQGEKDQGQTTDPSNVS